MSATLGQFQCVHGCRDVEYGQACTDTPGIVHPSGDQVTMCPPGRTCDDAVVHRTVERGWHTCQGTTADDWYAQRGMGQGVLDLEGSAS